MINTNTLLLIIKNNIINNAEKSWYKRTVILITFRDGVIKIQPNGLLISRILLLVSLS
mgnify:FL=1